MARAGLTGSSSNHPHGLAGAKENPMKPVIFALALSAAAMSGNALAWNYIVVDKSGHETFNDRPPMDLTYPPASQHMQVTYEGDLTPPSGMPLTRQEETRRRNGSVLIITDSPSAQASGAWIGNRAPPQIVDSLSARP
jgi:hypothetical protein